MSAKSSHRKPPKPNKGRGWKSKARKRTAPGSAPGTLFRDPEAPETKITVMAYSGDDITESRVDSVEAITAFQERRKPNFWTEKLIKRRKP